MQIDNFRGERSAELRTPWPTWRWQLLLLGLTFCTLLTHGFHPMAEDGGVYVAGLEYVLNPHLFPHYTDFVREHLRFSIFSPLLAAFIRATGLSVHSTLLIADLVTIWGSLAAAREILRRCTPNELAQLCGISLLAAWWTLPVAATSLLLMDPYVTARSFSVPLSLFAVGYAMNDWPILDSGSQSARSWLSLLCCGALILVAGLFHPLMAGYGAALVLLVRLSRLKHRWIAWSIALVGAFVFCAILQTKAPADSSAMVEASVSRYYWFLSQWHWYELIGVAAPLLILWALLRWRAKDLFAPGQALQRAAIVFGIISLCVAALFARENAASHLVARLQPLRAFLYIYALMAMFLGVELWQMTYNWRCIAKSTAGRLLPQFACAGVLALMAVAMFAVQRLSFPASPHVEWPWRANDNTNPWVQAFLWIRKNTPNDALFALDAKYVNTDGEDAQTFRAIALRSALPDYSKDGGEASITPSLASVWLQAATAQKQLSVLPDEVRDARVMPLGATWMVVASSAQTAHSCPYANSTVKICKLTR